MQSFSPPSAFAVEKTKVPMLEQEIWSYLLFFQDLPDSLEGQSDLAFREWKILSNNFKTEM